MKKKRINKIIVLDGKGKTDVQIQKQIKRWFKRNPNRVRIYIQTNTELQLHAHKDRIVNELTRLFQ